MSAIGHKQDSMNILMSLIFPLEKQWSYALLKINSITFMTV